MPNEVLVTDLALVRAWWEWSRQTIDDPNAPPSHPFVSSLLKENAPFSISTCSTDGVIPQMSFSDSLYLSISFKREADAVRFRQQWRVED